MQMGIRCQIVLVVHLYFGSGCGLWEDHQQCLGPALDVVWKADGIAVQGVGERKKIRNGRRFVPTGGRGGARPKEAVARTPPWLHPYATDAKKRKIERSVQRARAV